jgi:hypothetical protein
MLLPPNLLLVASQVYAAQLRILSLYSSALAISGRPIYAWDRPLSQPDRAIRDTQRRVMLMEGVIPTDELGYTSMTTGIAKRMGAHSTSPIALTLPPMLWAMRHLKISGAHLCLVTIDWILLPPLPLIFWHGWDGYVPSNFSLSR